MTVQGLSLSDIAGAMQNTNVAFSNNICYKRVPSFQRNSYSFTLTVKDSHRIGSKLETKACCWHVFRTLVTNLFGYGATRFTSAVGSFTSLSEFDSWCEANLTKGNCRCNQQ